MTFILEKYKMWWIKWWNGRNIVRKLNMVLEKSYCIDNAVIAFINKATFWTKVHWRQ